MSAYSEAVLALEPALYWALDAVTKAEDLSGNGRNGTGAGGVTVGGATGLVPSAEDNATQFDGSNDSITSTYQPYAKGSQRTIAFWAYRDSAAASSSFFGGNGSTHAYFRVWNGDSNTTMRVGWNSAAGPDSDFGSGTWVGNKAVAFVALTLDAKTREPTIYVNGESKGTVKPAGEGELLGFTSTFVVGVRTGMTEPFAGRMAHVAVFERLLSAEEIADLYTVGLEGEGEDPEGEEHKASAHGSGAGTGSASAHVAVHSSASASGTGTGTASGRLIAHASAAGKGEGTGAALVKGGLLPIRRRPTKPSLALSVEVETPSDTFTLHPGDKAANKPTNLSFGTERCTGFTTADYNLARPIYRDYPDVGLLDTHRFIGENGDVAYEGRLHSNPRSNDPMQQLKMSLVGFAQKLATTFGTPLIIDRRLEGWEEASLQRKANLLALEYMFNVSGAAGWQGEGATGPGLALTFSRHVNGYIQIGEFWKHAGGEEIGSIKGDFSSLGGAGENSAFNDFIGLSTDDVGTVEDLSTDFNQKTGAGKSVAAEGAGRNYALFSAAYNANVEAFDFADNVHALLYPRITGNHGLTAIGSSPNEGYGLTDIMQYVLQRYAPGIEWAGETNNFAVQQATWHDAPASITEIINFLNDLVLWESNVWEGPALHFHSADLTEPDWIVRSDEPGVSVDFTGDSIENFANGIVVTFTDLLTGQKVTLHPEDHELLRDDSEENPANRHNEKLYTRWDVPFPCFEGEALQQGAAQLAEYNRPKRPGTIRIQGHILDAAGHWHPGWKPRSSEAISIMDIFDDRPRLITSTSWDQDSRSMVLTLDVPPSNLDMYVARRAVAAAARNL